MLVLYCMRLTLTAPSRLVHNVRSNERSQCVGLSKEWDFAIEDQDAEFKDDLRAASGIGRSRRKVRRLTTPECFYLHRFIPRKAGTKDQLCPPRSEH